MCVKGVCAKGVCVKGVCVCVWGGVAAYYGGGVAHLLQQGQHGLVGEWRADLVFEAQRVEELEDVLHGRLTVDLRSPDALPARAAAVELLPRLGRAVAAAGHPPLLPPLLLLLLARNQRVLQP